MGPPNRSKFIVIGGDCGPHMGEVVDWLFFSGVLLGKRTADPECLSPTCYTPINTVSTKDVPLGSHQYISSLGRVIPKTPHCWDVGDFQLKRLWAYLSTEKYQCLMAQNASRKIHNVQSQKVGNGVISGVRFTPFTKHSIQWGFQAKAPC
jgi:hypothetical protein